MLEKRGSRLGVAPLIVRVSLVIACLVSGALSVLARDARPSGRHPASGPHRVTRPSSATTVFHPSAELGRKSYQVRCIACHRPDGSGGIKLNGNPTPDWRDAQRMADPRYGDAYLRTCIRYGKPQSGMPAWSRLGLQPTDIENLIAYIHTFAPQ